MLFISIISYLYVPQQFRILKSGPLMLIIITDMMIKFSGTAKRNISLIIVILLTVVFCGSIDLTCDAFRSGGIKARSDVSASHSLIAFPSAAVRGGNAGSNENDQSLEKESLASNVFFRIAKKFLSILECHLTQGSLSLLKHFYKSICIAGCTCIFLLTHIRFIHLKDGRK